MNQRLWYDDPVFPTHTKEGKGLRVKVGATRFMMSVVGLEDENPTVYAARCYSQSLFMRKKGSLRSLICSMRSTQSLSEIYPILLVRHWL